MQAILNSVGDDGIIFTEDLVRETLKQLEIERTKKDVQLKESEQDFRSMKSSKQAKMKNQNQQRNVNRVSNLQSYFCPTTYSLFAMIITQSIYIDTKPKLKFSNLLREEQEFLTKLANLDKFNFEQDFKVNGKRVRDAKVINK